MVGLEVFTQSDHVSRGSNKVATYQLQRHIWPLDFRLPTKSVLNTSHSLPKLRFFEANYQLCDQLVPGRPIQYRRIFSNPTTIDLPPIPAPFLRSLRLDDLPDGDWLELMAAASPELRMLSYNAECVSFSTMNRPIEMKLIHL